MRHFTEDVLNGFSGVGGWEVFDAELGLLTQCLELDPAAVQTALDAGHQSMLVDVTEYELSDHHPYTGAKFSPPCGPFSIAGKGEGRQLIADIVNCLPLVTANGGNGMFRMRLIHPEAALVLEPMRLIMQAIGYDAPFRWIVMEQTREVLPIFQAYAVELRKYGYSVAVGIVHAEQYGVPQSRTRVALIASLDKEVELPTPTHHRYRLLDWDREHECEPLEAGGCGVRNWVSMGEALPDLVDDRGTYLRSNYGTGGVAANRGTRSLRQPAPTITRKYNRNKWVVGGEIIRPLSEPEASVLQSFPADYPWHGKADERQLQLGNAIPPLLARAILKQVV